MDESLELAIYRNLANLFEFYCRSGEQEISERHLGWNQARSAFFERFRACEQFLLGIPERERTFLVNLMKLHQVHLVCEDGSVTMEADCSDFFAWACSDSESFEVEDLPAMIEAYERDGDLLFWIAERRGMQPQPVIKDFMIEGGKWTPEWDALPENPITVWEREHAEEEDRAVL